MAGVSMFRARKRKEVALPQKRHEGEPPYSAAAARQPEADIGTLRCHGCGNRRMRELLLAIAVDPARGDALAEKHLIEQKPRSRSALAIDETQAMEGDVAHVLHVRRVAARKDQPLLAIDEAYQSVSLRAQAA